MQNVCVRVAIERRLLHVMPESDRPITSAEMARATDTDEVLIGMEPSLESYRSESARRKGKKWMLTMATV